MAGLPKIVDIVYADSEIDFGKIEVRTSRLVRSLLSKCKLLSRNSTLLSHCVRESNDPVNPLVPTTPT